MVTEKWDKGGNDILTCRKILLFLFGSIGKSSELCTLYGYISIWLMNEQIK